MPIDFPNSPTNGDTYSEGTKTWQYNGTAWDLVLGSVSIPSGSVDTAQLASGAVTTAKILAGAVTTAKIAADSVTTAKIAANAVTQANLASTLSGVTICTSSTKPGSPFAGQIIYMTDTDETAVWEGTYWEGLNRAGGRNVVINGAMQVAQRGTSTAGITASGYFTADRFITALGTMGTFTQTVENDAPTGSGFRKSLKMNCTTADASPAAADVVQIQHRIEGQNLQQFCKGTAEAKQYTLSFYVKASLTGTYIAELADNDNTRQVSAAYTVVASNTWEEKTITFPADTTGEFDNDNASSLFLNFHLGAGSDRTSGTLNTVWGATVQANRAVGQVNLAGATSRTWQITGVQLEAGAVATPFEFEDIGVTLAKCFRYFYRHAPTNGISYLSYVYAGTQFRLTLPLPVQMRQNPSSVTASGWAGGSTPSVNGINKDAINFYSAAGNYYMEPNQTVIDVSAEL